MFRGKKPIINLNPLFTFHCRFCIFLAVSSYDTEEKIFLYVISKPKNNKIHAHVVL